tara:strand:+ start:240 stop:467 length:228 start_codon:yes stop_codon:yes gene_type:complete
MNKKITFEKTLSRLEEIIKTLEQGSPDLEEMMSLFEEGIKLSETCQEQLKLAEQRITTLIKDSNGFKEEEGIVSK